MKRIILIVALVATAIALFGVLRKPNIEDKNKGTVYFNWIPSASYTGDIVGVKKYAEKYNIELKGEFGGPSVNTVQLVQTGENAFGHASADQIIAANEKGADFVIVGVLSDQTPVVFLHKKGLDLKSPQDLYGKKVGVLPFGDTPLVYEHLLRKNNIDRSKLNEVTVDGDMKAFISGSYDIRPAFAYDETVDLDKLGIEYDYLEPKSFGVDIKGAVFFTKRETLENNPHLVEGFVRAMADGWNYTVKNPDAAIQILKEHSPEIDVPTERAKLGKGISNFTSYKQQPLNSDLSVWPSTIEALKASKIITKDVDLKNLLQFQYINEYYK